MCCCHPSCHTVLSSWTPGDLAISAGSPPGLGLSCHPNALLPSPSCLKAGLARPEESAPQTHTLARGQGCFEKHPAAHTAPGKQGNKEHLGHWERRSIWAVVSVPTEAAPAEVTVSDPASGCCSPSIGLRLSIKGNSLFTPVFSC